MIDPLLALRTEFPILARTNYLVSNSLGAMPRATADRVAEYARAWTERGVRAWADGWWGMPVTVGDEIAPLIGADAGEVAMVPNVTMAHAAVLSALDFTPPRDTIVMTALDFPSVRYVVERLAPRLGARVVTVPSEDGIAVDTERTIEAIDERTAFVNLSHVLFKSAYIHDVAAIAARARELGAVTIIDGYQAVGTIPVDVAALGVDVYIGGCLKWLCGGPGAAFLWVRPGIRDRLAPRLTGWMAHARPFAFAPALERRTDAWRFLHGTPNIPAFYAARAGLEVIGRVGIPAIRAKSQRQTARLIALAEARGYRCTTPHDPDRRGGTVTIDVEHGYEVSLGLKAREILSDYRPGAGIRLSPHFYTHDDELDAALDAIAEILAGDGWRAFTTQRSTVT